MFKINRQDRARPCALRLSISSAPRRPAFLVCQRQRAALFHRAQPGRQPGRADDGRQRPVGGTCGRLGQRGGTGRRLDAGAGQRVAQRVAAASGSAITATSARRARAICARRANCARRSARHVGTIRPARPHQVDAHSPTDPVAPKIEMLRTAQPPSTGRARPATSRTPPPAPRSARQNGPSPAMAGDQVRTVLDPDTPLQPAFGDVAHLTGQRDHRRHPAADRPPRAARDDQHQTSRSAGPAGGGPVQVFLGLSAGQNFGPPTCRPTKYPSSRRR